MELRLEELIRKNESALLVEIDHLLPDLSLQVSFKYREYADMHGLSTRKPPLSGARMFLNSTDEANCDIYNRGCV